MKVVAYSIKPSEKEYLAKANQKKHDITIIANPLSVETVAYASGKDAVIVSNADDVSAQVIEQLALLNVRFIVTQSIDTDHLDRPAAGRYGIKLANVLSTEPQAMADQTIRNLDMYQQKKCVGDTCACANACRAAVPVKVDNQTL
ncbi:Rossmann-fold NAD(P)-binding domain-containing protein [Mucilaginibacter myungsuensis]|uniref:Lactate dehydrogenase n=1 Tax=Mucilaginibacter myungsuensis TaxID=649104 RepID=A0A929KZB7_9SPHI|nr:lactate dehydrogenase [Mucilaginibacter myungsuensis]MBE9664481.1 lactate dehydrogenase [Mucilaginibacter myungsuensis]MDN3601374.1 lactate dehydrogenase [Mucilaginibacter myungsuensis]